MKAAVSVILSFKRLCLLSQWLGHIGSSYSHAPVTTCDWGIFVMNKPNIAIYLRSPAHILKIFFQNCVEGCSFQLQISHPARKDMCLLSK